MEIFNDDSGFMKKKSNDHGSALVMLGETATRKLNKRASARNVVTPGRPGVLIEK